MTHDVQEGKWSVKIDAKTPEGDGIYCLAAKFDLCCLPGRDNYRRLRNLSDTLDVPSTVQKYWMIARDESLRRGCWFFKV